MEELTLTPKDKQDARIALLKYYSSECVAHGAYLIALAVGFFGLVQVASLITSVDFLSFTELAGGIIANLMLSIFIVLIIYILGRTFFWGYLRTVVLNVKPKEESEVEFEAKRTTVTFIQRLHVACFEYVREKHKWSTKINTLKISTLALIWFYLFVAFTIVSLALLYLL
ncbi:MAG: hypothetical protein OEX76_00045 [Candidatus Bathyarchaeota archaeon]|nr:hypothetical protein [Candidatus Bathyarchaeota archaeon]MDH5532149.1 hypothetical protein [Candidatus Bathyarchaeota archaeon]MDH5712375.1 hypothetical protein [Candidatus Bathyarchaeota archaeon]